MLPLLVKFFSRFAVLLCFSMAIIPRYKSHLQFPEGDPFPEYGGVEPIMRRGMSIPTLCGCNRLCWICGVPHRYKRWNGWSGCCAAEVRVAPPYRALRAKPACGYRATCGNNYTQPSTTPLCGVRHNVWWKISTNRRGPTARLVRLLNEDANTVQRRCLLYVR